MVNVLFLFGMEFLNTYGTGMLKRHRIESRATMWKHWAPTRFCRHGILPQKETKNHSFRKSILNCHSLIAARRRRPFHTSSTNNAFSTPQQHYHPRHTFSSGWSLVESRLWSNKLLHTNRIRCFGSSSTSNDTGDDEKENKIRKDHSDHRSAKTITDPVFAEYLAGQGDFLSPGGHKNTELPLKRRRRKKTVVVFEDEKELYRKIHRNQILQKEQSRQKTSANVHRALMGNVVICCGKQTDRFCKDEPRLMLSG